MGDDRHDTPVEVNTLAAEHAGADDVEVDITDEVEVVDEAAELLAVDGPPDGANEVTPTVAIEDACGFCRLVKLKRIMLSRECPPATCDDLWALGTCCGTRAGDFAWCQIRGLLSVDGQVTDCDRRKTPRGLPTGAPDRRRRR